MNGLREIREANTPNDKAEQYRIERDKAVAALKAMLGAFNVKDIDPLVAMVAIEKARAVVEGK